MRNRVLAAVIGLAILLPVLILGGELAVQICSVLVLLVGADEYARMAAPDDRGAWAMMLVTSFGLFSALLWAPAVWIAPLLALLCVACLLYGMFGVPDVKQGAQVSVRLIAGLLYLPLLLSFIPLLRAHPDGLGWIFVMLSATWLGDTGAYFAGRFLGRHKLFERISPKKTWEGVFGGILAGIGGACLVKWIALPDLAWGHAVILGAVLVGAGVIGDLTESMLKRAYGVKDSGWILPGHGGILDRIDGLLFTGPVLWVYVYLILG
ncbi:MAG: phosphatidate cytidylyltransferase [Myxococcota bacterium]